MRLMRPGRAAVCAGLSLTLALSPFVTTVATAVTNDAIESTSAELSKARAHLDELTAQCEEKFAELEDQQAELEVTRQQITDTQGQIEAKGQELVEARAVLADNVAENYKNGTNFLTFLCGATSLDDLVSRVYYADKVAEYQANTISTVTTIQEELDTQKSNLETEQQRQEQLVAQTQVTASELQACVSEQESYVDSLDAQLQAEIQAQIEAERKAAEEQARKEAEEKARKEAEEKARQEAEAAALGVNTDGTAATSSGETTSADVTNTTETTTTGNTGTTEDDTPASTSTRPVGNYGSGVAAAIEYAKSQVGVSYSWGGNAIENREFDCSGLVWWAFGKAGISIPRGQRLSNGRGDSMIGWCLDRGGWTTSQANLQAGDLMFWGSDVGSTGHVGLCIGGGLMVHSNWNGVEICSVYYNSGSFVGGGPVV